MKNLYSNPLAWVALAAAKRASDTILTCYNRTEEGIVATDRHRWHFSRVTGIAEGVYDAQTGLASPGFGSYPPINVTQAGPHSLVLDPENRPIVAALVEGSVAVSKTLKRPGTPLTLIWVPNPSGDRLAFDGAYVRDALAGFPEDEVVHITLQGIKQALRLETATGDRAAVISKVDVSSVFNPPFDLTPFLTSMAGLRVVSDAS